jgi:hypothetical protein
MPDSSHGALETVIEVALDPDPAVPDVAVTGWASWRRGDVELDQVDLVARMGADGALTLIELTSAFRDLSPFSTLTGTSATSGFRRRMREVHTSVPGSLLAHRLLDDMPITIRVSHQARIVDHPALTPAPIRGPRAAVRVAADVPGVDQCEGWQAGGKMVRQIIEGRGQLIMALGEPVQPGVAAWSPLPAPPPMATRRRRRLELRDGPHGTDVTAFYRDSYSDPDGIERGLHSYGVRATVDDDGTVTDIDATGLILPWPECWGAPASASRLRGIAVGQATDISRTQLVGLGTCTHLTDMLSTFADIAELRGIGTA